jgi:hypothetical protein
MPDPYDNTPGVRRTKLDFRSLAEAPDPPEPPEEGDKALRLWLTSAGSLATIDQDGVEGSLGGEAGGVTQEELEDGLATRQPLDSDLTAIAALTTTAYGRSLLAAADAAGLRSLAGLPLNNYAATAPPGVGDDSGDGYSVGSTWIDITGDAGYICVDASVGAAVWSPFDAGAGGGSGYIAATMAHPDLVQYWPLNDGPSATSYDDVMGGTDLSIVGTIGKGGPALQLDTAGGSVHLRGVQHALQRTAITWPAQWTIEGWFVFEVLPSDACIIGQWNGAGAMLHTGDGDTLRLYVGGSNATWSPGAAALQGLHHVAVTYDGADACLVFDGDEKLRNARTAPSGSAGGVFALGRYSTDQGSVAMRYLVGDVAMFDRALTEAECLARYQLGRGI